MRKFITTSSALCALLLSTCAAQANSLEVVATNNLPPGSLADSMTRYTQDLGRMLSMVFTPPTGKDSRTVKVGFELDNTKKMTGLKIESSSNWSVADECAIRAVKIAADGSYFRPFPKNAPSPVAFSVEFKYTVDN